MGSLKNMLWTFLIGLVAGAAPFICMSYVPALISPGAVTQEPNATALVVIAVVVGFVTVIQYARNFDKDDPREVFTRSLAIPSILIATVTGLQSNQTLAVQRNSASSAIDSVATDVPIVPVPIQLQEIADNSGAGDAVGWLWLPSAAHAQTPAVRPAVARPAVRSTPDYLVTLGSFTTEEAAKRQAARWSRPRSLATERYVQKSVRVFSGGTTYYVTYTTALPRAEAVRLYKLLRINDPKVTPQVIQMPGAIAAARQVTP